MKMPPTFGRAPRRFLVPGITALALGLALSACGAANESNSGKSGISLDGAGSSAQESAMDAWRSAFQKDNTDVTVNYDPSGSGAGVEKFNAGGIDFAGSDSGLSADKGEIEAAKKRCGADAIEVRRATPRTRSDRGPSCRRRRRWHRRCGAPSRPTRGA